MKILIQILLLVVSFQACQTKGKTYILVHGAWHGAWCWKKVVPLLENAGHHVLAIDLPGHGKDSARVSSVTMKDYVNKVVDEINAQQGQVILVGHSMAGVVISQAAEVVGREKIEALVYLDAFMPKNGESVFSLAEKAALANGARKSDGPSLMESLVLSGEGKISHVRPDAVSALFYHDCKEDDILFALRHVGWQPMACLGTPVNVTETRYGAIAKYYILCTKARDLDKTSLSTNMPCRKNL
jgi:pimeloyl-ACP methyl ester carboxylesterase